MPPISVNADTARPHMVSSRLTTRWSRPGQPDVGFGAILALAGRAAHLEAVGRLKYIEGGCHQRTRNPSTDEPGCTSLRPDQAVLRLDGCSLLAGNHPDKARTGRGRRRASRYWSGSKSSRARRASVPAFVRLWTTCQAQPTPTDGRRRDVGGGSRITTTLSSSWLAQIRPLHLRLLRSHRERP